MRTMFRWTLIVMVLNVLACSQLEKSDVEAERKKIDQMALSAIDDLKKKDPELHEKLNNALAYGVANMKLTKVPIVGAGGGEGILYVRGDEEKTYFSIKRIDLGGGWGARAYKVLMILNTQEEVDKWRDGEWQFEAGAEASAGTAAVDGAASAQVQDFELYVLQDGGALVTATVRAIRVKVNKQLSAFE